MKKYIVGGAVRDLKLGKEPHDKDYVVVGSTPEEMIELGYKQVGKDFPVFLHPETHEEYALARKEISTGDGYQDFKFDFNPNISLKDDLRRRDFTINAMAQDIETGEIIDYFGGLKDLKEKLVKHIDDEHFVEDPLRVLRACRQAVQLEFHIDLQTIMLCRKMVRLKMLEALSAERVWKEIEKALHTPNMYAFLEFLGLTNALYHVLPEVFALTNIPENVTYHPEGNTYSHVQLTFRHVGRMFMKANQTVSDLLEKDLHNMALVNFALLCHDLGKAQTPVAELPAHHGHDERGLEIIDKLCNRLKVPNEYRDFAKKVCKHHMKFYEFLKTSTKKQYDIVKELSNNFKDYNQLRLVCICHKCDLMGRKGVVTEERINTCKAVCEHMEKIFNIMHDITLSDLPKETQEALSQQKGEKFGKLYRDAMISYLKHGMVSYGKR